MALRRKRTSRRKSGGWLLAGILLAVPAILALALGWSLWNYADSPGPELPTGELYVVIPQGTSLAGIERILATNGLITADRRFSLLARLQGRAQRLKAGEYRFTSAQTPNQILRMLETGAVARWSLTVPEGANLRQIADLLAAGNWATREEFLAMTRDPALLARYGVPGPSFEGYLFPDTYQLLKGQTAAEILEKMLKRGWEVRSELGDLADNRFGLSVHQVLTLASIVEKETGVPAERPLIARVFLNRLNKGMRLQTDPTVIYGIADFDGNLTRKHLETPTPYNTYRISGLPPGPIASPGRAAIAAVLSPAEGDELYFVSKNDGSHHFSESLDEHNQAVYRYQKSRAATQANP